MHTKKELHKFTKLEKNLRIFLNLKKLFDDSNSFFFLIEILNKTNTMKSLAKRFIININGKVFSGFDSANGGRQIIPIASAPKKWLTELDLLIREIKLLNQLIFASNAPRTIRCRLRDLLLRSLLGEINQTKETLLKNTKGPSEIIGHNALQSRFFEAKISDLKTRLSGIKMKILEELGKYHPVEVY